MTAIRLGMPWLGKADNAAGRYFWRPSRVYREIQSAGVVNWSGGHSTRRPSLLRMGSQCLVITLGSSVSDAAVRGTKRLEFSMSLLEGEAPASNPRRLLLTLWTHSKSEVKTSYLLERMSLSVIPLGRDASRGGGLSSVFSVAHFFGGDECGLVSPEGHLWSPVTSSLGVETASGQPPGKLVTSSCNMMTSAASSEVNAGMVTSRSIASCSNGLSSSMSMGSPTCEGPGTAG